MRNYWKAVAISIAVGMATCGDLEPPKRPIPASQKPIAPGDAIVIHVPKQDIPQESLVPLN